MIRQGMADSSLFLQEIAARLVDERGRALKKKAKSTREPGKGPAWAVESRLPSPPDDGLEQGSLF